MDPYDLLRLGRDGEFGFEVLLASQKVSHPCADHIRRKALGLVIRPRSIKQPFRLGQLRLKPGSEAPLVGRRALSLSLVGLGELPQQVRRLQVLLEPSEHSRLDFVQVEYPGVVTGARLAPRAALNADPTMIAVLDRQTAAAATALEQTGEQIARLPLALRRVVAAVLLSRLRRVEQSTIDDGQFGRIRSLPLLGRVRPRDAPAGVRILHHPDTVPDEHAGVEFVQKYPMVARLVPVDRGSPPTRSAWRGDTLAIQIVGDLPRRAAGDVLAKNTADDFRLAGDYLQFTRLAANWPIAVGATSGVPPVAHNAVHPSPDLVGEIDKIERTQKPPDPDLDLVGRALVNRPKLDPRERQPLPDAGEVLLIA